jgi:hypothetical protein
VASYVALLDFLTLRFDGQRYPRLPGGSHVLGNIVIGCFNFESPERILGTFGLKMLHRQVLLLSLAYRYTMSVIMHFAHREFERRNDDDKTKS